MIEPNSYKILTVDDDEDIRDSISMLLEGEGFNTVRAKNGRVALDYLNSIPDIMLPDLVLLDYMMPVMNGDDFCKAKANIQRLAHIPVIMMTASGNLIKVMDMVQSEAEGYLSKPMDIHSVISMIEYFLTQKKTPEELSTH